MKKIFTLIMLGAAIITASSCSKSNNNGNPNIYTVSGLGGISLSQGEDDELMLTINNTGDFQETVSLNVEGLPSGVSVSFSTKSGIPTFSTRITFSNNSAAMGTYDCRLAITGASTGTKYYDFTLVISNEAACGLPGPYIYTATCNGQLTGTDSLLSFTNTASVRFGNFGAHGWIVYGYVNCATGVIEVPLQSVGNNTQVGGTGSFTTTGNLTMSYTIFTSGGNTDCNFTMLRSN